jgi:hypothetical protein
MVMLVQYLECILKYLESVILLIYGGFYMMGIIVYTFYHILSVLRIWDVLLYEGNRSMLFRTALALLEQHGKVGKCYLYECNQPVFKSKEIE